MGQKNSYPNFAETFAAFFEKPEKTEE